MESCPVEYGSALTVTVTVVGLMRWLATALSVATCKHQRGFTRKKLKMS